MTGVSGDTKPTEGSLITGTTFHETNTDDLYIWDGDSWNVVAGASAQVSFLDEDNFASDSAVAVASQQSIKAYVASQVPGSQNVFNTIAVSGQDNVVADSATDTLTLAAGSNITLTTTAGSDTVTIAASGGTQNLFQTIAVSGQSNVVADSSTDTLTLVGGTNVTITTNASNDTITFAASGGDTLTVTDNESTNENNLITFVADAGSSTGAHGLEMDGNLHYNPSTGTLTSTVFAGNLTGNASGTAATVTGATQSAITTAANLVTVGALDSGSITSGFTSIDVGSGAITTTGTVTAGDLVVNGTTTTINSATLTVDDKNLELGSVSSPSDTTADGGGITLKGATDKTIIWDNSNDNWTSNQDWNIASGKAFKVNNASVLNATTLGAAVVNSSLQTLGTIGTGVWQGTAIAQTYIADQAINEAKLQISNAPQNGYVLSAQSGNTGGMTWVAAGGGETNESSFKTIVISGQTDIVADSSTDTLTFAAGTGIALTTNASTDTVTITNSSTGASESFAIAMAVAL